MIALDSTASLVGICGEASTTQLLCNATYIDTTQSSAAAAGPYLATVAFSASANTDATILSAPSAGVGRQLASLVVQNIDNVTHTVTIRTKISSTYYRQMTAILQVGETLTYEHGTGWRVLDSTGAARVSAYGNLVARRVYTGNATWTKPSVLSFVIVTVVGGGGGGGGTAVTTGATDAGTGGGGGGASIKKIAAASLSSTETVTVGAGGPATGLDGSAGGTSSFGAHCSATGGYGGTNAGAVANSRTWSGGYGGTPASEGGTGSGGDINTKGGPGGAASVNGGNNSAPGHGGNSIFGGGANALTVTTGANNGNAGSNYGGGGSGANSVGTGSTKAGGAGAPGVVIVDEYI